MSLFQSPSFKEKQKQFERVKHAFEEKEDLMTSHLAAKGITAPFDVFLRAFKKERMLEVWVKNKSAYTYTLVVEYPFCSSSGELGPKRKEGDLQIPEGVYYINHFNPESNFHLSLGINYPNAADRAFADAKHPGGSIYIHGNCVTVGCIPITDDKIKELYILAVEAKDHGQDKIPIHIFADRLDLGVPEKLANEQPQHLAFWKNMQTIYLDFKAGHQLKKVSIDSKGMYELD